MSGAMISSIKQALVNLLGTTPSEITPITEGVASVNFVAHCGEQAYIVRLDTRRTEDEAEIDVVCYSAAEANGVMVPPRTILTTRRNRATISVRPYIPGANLAYTDIITYARFAELAGENLASIHTTKLIVNRRHFYAFTYDSNDTRRDVICEYASRHPDRQIANMISTVPYKLEDIAQVVIPFCHEDCLLHGDYKPANLLVTPLSKLAVLDWEKASNGPELYDLSLALFHFYCSRENCPRRVVEMFLQGYQRIRQLSSAEQKALPEILDCAASAFFLVDTAFAAKNCLADARQFNQRREDYYRYYCIPTFVRYLEDRQLLADLIGSA